MHPLNASRTTSNPPMITGRRSHPDPTAPRPATLRGAVSGMVADAPDKLITRPRRDATVKSGARRRSAQRGSSKADSLDGTGTTANRGSPPVE
jgi:hypothetical protein